MTNATDSFERRIAALVEAIADRMPADVDPMAMSRLAADGAAGVRFRGAVVEPMARLGFVGLVVALMAALVGGALIAGGIVRTAPTDPLAVRVLPVVGLPPEGAPPSEPAVGELVLSIAARISTLGHEVHVGYFYADGRMIWQRNLEGFKSAQDVFDDVEPTRALIEQRLTPAGMDMIWNAVRESLVPRQVRSSTGRPGVNRPGTTAWGFISLSIDGALVPIAWSSATLPRRLADPGSWLPADAWADRTLRAYVPSSYAVCLTPGVELAHLPQAAADTLRVSPGSAGPGNPFSVGTCYKVTTDAAREIAATLDAAGFGRGPMDWDYTYVVPAACCPDVDITRFPMPAVVFLEVLPHGEFFQRGG